jgi:DNA-binding SARP family transcriptional activator
MEFRILGPLEVIEDGAPLPLGGPRQRSVLAYLLLHANQPVSKDRLLASVWGVAPNAGTRNSLHSTVSRLRQVLQVSGSATLANERIVSKSGTYQLRIDPDELDALRFEMLAESASEALDDPSADLASASTDIRTALSLWRGEVLADLNRETLDQGAVAQLESMRRMALETKAEADLRTGKDTDIIRDLTREIYSDPLNEQLRYYLMRALYKVGRAADAADEYQNFKQTLEDERGMSPSPKLRRLHSDIQRQQVRDPWLPNTSPKGDQDPALVEQQTPRSEKSGPSPDEIFVGRKPELKRLRAAVTALQAGQGRLLLIAGEMGIGKSHLVRRLALDLKTAEMDVLWGRVWEDDGAPVYWPWLMIVRQLLESRDSHWLNQCLGQDAAVVAQLVPEVAQRIPNLAEPPRLEPNQDRFRLFDSLTRFLRRAVRRRPLVLVLDDLHRADESSLLLLRFLTRELQNAELLIVATYRDSRADQSEEFARALAELTREPVTSRLTLQGFNEADVARFVELAAGIKVSDAFVVKLHERTSGNPLFLKEIARPLVDGHDPATFERALNEFVPQGVHEAVERRLSSVPKPTRHVLEAASVIGQQFVLEVLTKVTGMVRPRLLELLDQAILLDYVTSTIDGSKDRYRFSHVLIRDALYERLPSARRAALHRRAGEAVEDIYADDLEARYSELAHHFLHASGESDNRKSLHYLQHAGNQAVQRFAFADAVRLFESALQGRTSRADRCDLLLALADAQMKAGRTQRARTTFLQAADTAKALGDSTRFARAVLGFGSQLADFGLVNEQLVELLEEALGQLDNEAPSVRARVLGRLAEALYWVNSVQHRDVVKQRARLSAEAVRLARMTREPDTLATALHARWYATWRPDNAEERRNLAAELHQVADHTGNWQMSLRGRMYSIITALELGDTAAADAEIKGYEDEATALGQRYLLALPRLWQATRAMMRGSFEDAERLNQEAQALSKSSPDAKLVENATTLQQWFLDDERGRREALERAREGFVDRFPGFPSWRLPLALMRLASGEPEEADRELRQFTSLGLTRLPQDANWLTSMTLLAEICAALNDKVHAPYIYELLAPYSNRRVVIGFAAVCRSSVSLQLGQLAALLGRWDAADQYFSAALTANRQSGARPALVQTQYRYALALLARGRGDDWERARELFERCGEEAAELGMAGLKDEVAQRLVL